MWWSPDVRSVSYLRHAEIALEARGTPRPDTRYKRQGPVDSEVSSPALEMYYLTSGFSQRAADQQPRRRPGCGVASTRPAPPRTEDQRAQRSRTCSACQAEAGNSAANAATVRTVSRPGPSVPGGVRGGRDATRRGDRPDRRRHWHFYYVPLLHRLSSSSRKWYPAAPYSSSATTQSSVTVPNTATSRINSAAIRGLVRNGGPRGRAPRPAGYGPRASIRTNLPARTAGGPAGPTLPGSPRSGRRRPGSCPAQPAVVLPLTVFTPLNPAQPLGCTVNQVDAEPQDEEAEEQAEMRAA